MTTAATSAGEATADPHDMLSEVTRRHAGEFSYAASIENPAARMIGRGVENLFGRGRLERRYRAFRRDRAVGRAPVGTFWDEAVRRMDVRVNVTNPERIPATGALVAVANHPFGAMDGIAIAHALGRVRGDVLILAHEALARVPETRPHLLTVDFSATRGAERHNVRMRAAALRHLRRGGALLVFPAGNVMTTPHALARRAVDAPWGSLTARLVMKSGAAVLPIHVPGQNGRLFQIVSQFSQTLRYALLFREATRHIRGRIELRLGELIDPRRIAAWGDADAVTARLRAHVDALADGRAGERMDEWADDLWLDPVPPVPCNAAVPDLA